MKEKRGRGGRPPAGSEHDVEARLLAAATRLFLERGYDGTSCDQVALDARAGKASIYARYANKDALFAAVVDQLLGSADSAANADAVAISTPVRERLAATSLLVVQEALHPDALALLRLLMAQLTRYPAMGLRAQQFRQAAVRRVAEAIAGEAAMVDSAVVAAEQFIDLVLQPVLLRALMGEDPAPLLAGLPQRIDAAIATLDEQGLLTGQD